MPDSPPAPAPDLKVVVNSVITKIEKKLEDPETGRWLVRVAIFLVKLLCPDHTVAKQVVTAAEDQGLLP